MRERVCAKSREERRLAAIERNAYLRALREVAKRSVAAQAREVLRNQHPRSTVALQRRPVLGARGRR